MNKYFIPFLVLGTTLLYSCAKEEVTSDTDSSSSVEKVKMEFKAGVDAMSRTVLTTNNFVEWEAGDAIYLYLIPIIMNLPPRLVDLLLHLPEQHKIIWRHIMHYIRIMQMLLFPVV